MDKHVPDRINLDDFGGMLLRLAMIAAVVFVAYILLSGSFW